MVGLIELSENNCRHLSAIIAQQMEIAMADSLVAHRLNIPGLTGTFIPFATNVRSLFCEWFVIMSLCFGLSVYVAINKIKII
jgi:hypothetical protein